MANFLLLHGAWHGAWCWSRVTPLLTAAGHKVLTPTQTGLGERAHLLTREVGLETFIADVVAALDAADFQNAVLVGHSFGGLAVSGAAERVPGRIKRLVFLDALLVEGGKAPFDLLPADIRAQRIAAAQAFSGGLALPPPDPASFGVTDAADAAWLRARMTPHPLRTYTDALPLKGPVGAHLPRTYVACTDPVYAPLARVRDWVRRRPGWEWRELRAGHDAMVTAPRALADLLLDFA